MHIKTHFHHSHESDWNDETVGVIKKILSNTNLSIEKEKEVFRSSILGELHKNGWTSNAKLVYSSSISVTAMNEKYALCFQTGNMGRFYADLLKLQYLFSENKISRAIYIIPTKRNAKKMGQNIANFERFTEELSIFSPIVTVPMIVFGLD